MTANITANVHSSYSFCLLDVFLFFQLTIRVLLLVLWNRVQFVLQFLHLQLVVFSERSQLRLL